jgi:SAM-dependent methyltransferase
MFMTDPTRRFSSRVDNYSKYRPHYPPEVVATLRDECGLASSSVIADIGSGTGFLSELFLKNGNPVFAVEPNCDMRAAAGELLKYPGFHNVSGRAEDTTLEDHSVDFVVSGQAFHWFDLHPTRNEFMRILKTSGCVMIVWNERELETAPFLIAYENILKEYAPECMQMDHKKAYRTALTDFYGASGFETRVFHYQQLLDYAGVKGRLLSSSYTPESGHPNHEPMLAALLKVFHAHEVNGRVAFEYTTRMYFGRLGAPASRRQ